jgi:hypothetical protein
LNSTKWGADSQQEKIVDSFNDNEFRIAPLLLPLLIPGFDVRLILINHVIDKSIKDHTLLQAI